MFKNNTMTAVTHLGIVARDILDIDRFVVAAITTNPYPEAPNIHYAGILMPPTWMLMRWAEGDMYVLQTEYPKYLATKDCDEMIIALLAVLSQRNVILYIPQDEFDIFGPVFLNHLYYTYGIIVNTPTTMFSVDVNKYPLIMSKFYLMNIMTAEDYLASFPAQYQLPEWVINKLAMDLQPFPNGGTFNDYQAYFNKMNMSKMVRKPLPVRDIFRGG